MKTAFQHATKASELLVGAEAFEERLANMSDDERLQASIAGGIAAANRDLQWTVDLARAHALTAMAIVQAQDFGTRHGFPPSEGDEPARHSLYDATASNLECVGDGVLESIVEGDLEVSEVTRRLARAELDSRRQTRST